MLGTNERLAALEAKIEDLRREVEVISSIPTNIVRVIVDRLVDERTMTPEARRSLWKDIEDETRAIGGHSDIVRHGVLYSLPRYPAPQLERVSADRERKPLLRIRANKSDEDE